MNVRKFSAGTSRQALHLVRQGLGPDALILSNRAVEGGVEILAVAPGDLPPHAATAQAAPRGRQGKAAVSGRDPQPATPAPAAAAAVAEDPVSRSLAREIKSMRGLIEQQLVYQAWDTAQRREPGKARVLRDMLHAGFSAALVRQFLAKMPPGLGEERKLGWVKAVLERNLRTVAAADEMVERGGVYALVGPTGVGKTTTVAKIAARCVVRYGADRIALLTTDGYRIGAHEQLRIYGKLLGVRVIAIKDASDLQFVLDDLRGKHLVLIDTVGMSQRDEMVVEQLALLSASGTQVQRLLLLNATGNGETLDDVVRAYRGGGVHGCIITKTDEAMGIATTLDIVIRHRLSLHYVTDGQRVPEDLHLPDREHLLERALRPVAAPSVHHLDAAECQLMLATASAGGTVVGASLG
ncbi:MAG: flagellar biosynthesis protein FlhF [Betaproteobacteria bacterium]|nr:flagellar biosynthesis protein FlhF [Betaproteobacteria bacterium]